MIYNRISKLQLKCNDHQNTLTEKSYHINSATVFSLNCGIKLNPTNRRGEQIHLDIISVLSVNNSTCNFGVPVICGNYKMASRQLYSNILIISGGFSADKIRWQSRLTKLFMADKISTWSKKFSHYKIIDKSY